MKNLSDILRKSSITPLERVTVIVHDDINKEKTGKGILSDSDLYSLTKGWASSTYEAKEYNRYISIVQLECSMRLDAQMFFFKSEASILRNQRVLDHVIFNNKRLNSLNDQDLTKDISREESMELVTKYTYLDYQKTLHIFTYNNLPKEIRKDLLILDGETTYDNKYLEAQVFLYEIFKDLKKIGEQDKNLIIERIYSCMYYEGAKKIRNSTKEKDGFLLNKFFADLQMKDVIKKLIDNAHIYNKQNDTTEENLLSIMEEYAKSKNTSIESLVKETLSNWLDNGLFVKDYPPIFMSNNFNTWNGNTKNSHKELFMIWYKELQKSKQHFQNIFDTGILVKQSLEKDFLGMPKMIEIITGSSLYDCKEDINFVKEYKQQIEVLLPISTLFIFINKYATPIKNYKTFCEFKDIVQKISAIFDIDMTEKYREIVDLYKKEVTIVNYNLNMLLDKAMEHIYMEKSLQYIFDINESGFTFDLNTNDGVLDIAEMYSTKFKELDK